METIDYETFKSRYEALATAAARVYRENPEIGDGNGRSVPSGHSFEHAYTNGYSNAKLALRQALLVLHIRMYPIEAEEKIDEILAKPAEKPADMQEADSSAEGVSWEPFYVTRLQLNAWLNELDEGADPAKVFASIPKSADPEHSTDDLFQTSEAELKALGATAMPWPRQVILETIRDGAAVIGQSPAEETVVVDAVALRYWLTRATNGAPIGQFVQTALDTPAKEGKQLIEVPRQRLEDVLLVEGSQNKAAELEDIVEKYSTHYVKPIDQSDNGESAESTPMSAPIPETMLSADARAIIQAIEKLGVSLGYKITGGE